MSDLALTARSLEILLGDWRGPGSAYEALAEHCPRVVVSLQLARALHPGKRNNLDALCERYQVDHSARTEGLRLEFEEVPESAGRFQVVGAK